MATYNRSKIRRIIEQLAGLYDMHANDFMVIKSAALVMHGLKPLTPAITLVMHVDAWAEFSAFHKVETDHQGVMVKLPGDIVIRPLSAIKVDQTFEKAYGCQIATLQALLDTYLEIATRTPNGEEVYHGALRNAAILEKEIAYRKEQAEPHDKNVANAVGKALVDLLFYAGLSNYLASLGERTKVHDFKDGSHNKWRLEVDPINNNIMLTDLRMAPNGKRYNVDIIVREEDV